MSVLPMAMPTERRGRTNITKNVGSIDSEPVRMQKVKQLGRRGTTNMPTILFYFILFYYSFEQHRARS